MKPAAQLSQFVQDGLRAGHSRDELRTALAAAGWSALEIDTALAAWSNSMLRVPVPRPVPAISARDVMIYGLMAVALLAVTWHLVQLCFGLIDLWLQDPVTQSYVSTNSMRWSIATLSVVTPLFLWLHIRAEGLSRRDPGHRRAPLRARFGAAALFLAALVLLGDAIAVVFALLNGELSAQFVAKALVVAGVAGLVMLWGRGFLNES